MVRRLNQVASDLGLAPPGRRDLFLLDDFSFDITPADAAGTPLEPGPVEVFDVTTALEDIDEWFDFATKLEKIAERFADMERAQRASKPLDPNQQRLPGIVQG